MNKEIELERGLKAKQLLENEIYQESFNTVRQAIIDAWANSPIRDEEGQRYLRLMLKALTDTQNYIKSVADTGRMAEIQLEQEKSIKDRVRQFFA